MAEVRWIKIVTDIFDDEKILLIEQLPEKDTIIVIWFKLLCLAGKQNNSGVFTINDKIPYTEEMLSAIFRRPINTIRMALNFFEQYGMIEIINGVITIPNWGKHQNLDSIERKKEYMRTYMQEYRQKQLCKTNSKANSKTNSKANVSRTDKDIDKKEIREDKNIDISTDKPSDTTAMPPHCNGIANAMPLEDVNVNINKDINNKSKKGVKGEKRELFKDYSNGNEELYNALLGFEEMRNKIKKPMTDRAKVLMLKDLDGLTNDDAVKVKILDRSTKKCWLGVFQLDETKDKPKNDLKGNKGFRQRKYSKEQLDALYDDIEEFDV